MNDLDLTGRVVVITGAGRGLGLSHARLLASRGAHVVVNDVVTEGQDPAADAESLIKSEGGSALACSVDIASPEGGAALVGAAIARYGRLDGVVHNAGILRDRTLVKLLPSDVRDVLAVHLEAAFWIMKPAMEVMKSNGFGRVVLTTSSSGLFGTYGQANYAAAKMGLIGLMRVLSLEGARAGIVVNAVAPSARTRMTEDLLGPLSERLDAGHVSPLVAYLCSAACETGSRIFSAGGGRYASAFIGLTPGWVRRGEGFATIEDVAANIGRITDREGYVVPDSGQDELKLMLEALGDPDGLP